MLDAEYRVMQNYITEKEAILLDLEKKVKKLKLESLRSELEKLQDAFDERVAIMQYEYWQEYFDKLFQYCNIAI